MDYTQRADRVLGYEQLTGLNTAKGFTAIPAGTSAVLITPLTQSIRWRADGTDPTAALGQPVLAGQELRLTIAQLAQWKCIETTASAEVNCTFLGQG